MDRLPLLVSLLPSIPGLAAIAWLWQKPEIQPLVKCEVASVTCQCNADGSSPLYLLVAFFVGLICGAWSLRYCGSASQSSEYVSKRPPTQPRGQITYGG